MVLAVWLVAPQLHAARLEVSTGEPVEILINVSQPTVVTLPERIQAIPTSADPNAVSLELVENRLFIQSLQAGFGATVFVIGESGKLHILRLVESETPDIEVQLVEPKARIQGVSGDSPPRPGRRRPGRPAWQQGSALRRLLVALLKGGRLPGVEAVAHDQVLASSPELEIRTTHLYAAGRYLGFIGVARNLTEGPFVLRLPEFQAAGLKAIYADLETIPAGGETRMVLVVEPGSPY